MTTLSDRALDIGYLTYTPNRRAAERAYWRGCMAAQRPYVRVDHGTVWARVHYDLLPSGNLPDTPDVWHGLHRLIMQYCDFTFSARHTLLLIYGLHTGTFRRVGKADAPLLAQDFLTLWATAHGTPPPAWPLTARRTCRECGRSFEGGGFRCAADADLRAAQVWGENKVAPAREGRR